MDELQVLGAFTARLIFFESRRLRAHACFQDRDVEDIAQEIVLHLLTKAKQGVLKGESRAYVARVIHNKGVCMMRARHRQKRDYQRESVSLNATVAECDGQIEMVATFDETSGRRHTLTVRRTDQEKVTLSRDIESVLADVSEEERRLAELLKTESKHRISQTTGTSRRKIDNSQRGLLAQFENAALRDYL